MGIDNMVKYSMEIPNIDYISENWDKIIPKFSSHAFEYEELFDAILKTMMEGGEDWVMNNKFDIEKPVKKNNKWIILLKRYEKIVYNPPIEERGFLVGSRHTKNVDKVIEIEVK